MRLFWTAALCLGLIVLGNADQAFPTVSNGMFDENNRAVARSIEADTSSRGHFERVVLVERTTDPIELAIAPDGRVFFVEREGSIRVWQPESGRTQMVGFLDVEMLNEDGVLGITLDPDFETNGWMYVYYSPQGTDPKNVLSRVTIEDNQVVPGSENIMLEVPTQRKECCHTGGSLAFGPDGSLFLSTGDNTNPFASDGFAPIDERPGREPWDAQRSSANTRDLRGKILRIRPLPDGTYAIPEGNLFSDEDEGRPEIYVMGNRNPYRISVDEETGWLYWGEVGPDAGAANPERGPAGHDEFNQAKEAGNYGWPLFVGDNKAYHEYNFETEESGPAFDPERPHNRSANNTGAEILPPAQPALIWYPYGPSEEFPEVGTGGRTAMAGPVYHYNPETVGEHGLPQEYDESVFFYEWARNFFKEVELDADGNLTAIKPFLDEMAFQRPIDMEIGPNGRVYIIEWGPNFWGMTDEARIVRIDHHTSSSRPPVANIQAAPAAGSAPLKVEFSGAGSFSKNDSGSLDYTWDFDGDGRMDAQGVNTTFTYEESGKHNAQLTVTDASGMQATAEYSIVAGNTPPSLTIHTPVNGGFFDYGEAVPYRVAVADQEDSAVRRNEVKVQPLNIHNSHTHAAVEQHGPTGEIRISADNSHGPYVINDILKLEASYTDDGGAGSARLSNADHVVLHPKRKQAEHTYRRYGATREITGSIRDRTFYSYLQGTDGDYAVYQPINFHRIDSVTVRVSSEGEAALHLRLDAPDGPLVTAVEVPSTTAAKSSTEENGNPEKGNEDDGPTWAEVTVPISNPGGTHALYLVFGDVSDGSNLKVDWMEFHGAGVNTN